VRAPEARAPDAARAARVGKGCLRRGVIVLGSGDECNVVSLTPPLVITERQMEFALGAMEEAFAEAEA